MTKDVNKKRFPINVVVDKTTPVPIHFQVSSSITTEINRHSPRSELRLPSEYQLAKQLKISRGTVHKAYCKLLAEKVVIAKSGRRGLFVSPDRAGKFGIHVFPSLGVVLPLPFSTYLDGGQFDTLDYLGGILDAATEFGFSANFVALPSNDAHIPQFKKWMEQMRDKFSGMIHLGGGLSVDDRAFNMLLGIREIPQVFVSGTSTCQDVAAVIADASAGMLAVAEHLRRLGHTRVLLLEIRGENKASLFRAGGIQRGNEWVTALDMCRVACDRLAVPLDFENTDTVSEIFNKLTADGSHLPTAIICHNDALAGRVLAYLHVRRVAVPQEVSVVGYDDSLRTRDIKPPLTTIHQPRRALGREAVRLIFEYGEHGIPVAGKILRIPASLVVRDSIGIALSR